MSGDGWYRWCPDCDADEANCMCDENTADEQWLRDEEERERMREEALYLYSIPYREFEQAQGETP